MCSTEQGLLVGLESVNHVGVGGVHLPAVNTWSKAKGAEGAHHAESYPEGAHGEASIALEK